MPLDVARLVRIAASSPVLARNIVQIAELDGAEVRYVAEHLGRAPFASTARPGDRRDASATAIGLAALGQVGDRGYALDPGGVHPSVFGVAIPVPGHPGSAIGVPLVEVLPHVWQEDARRYTEVVAALRAATAVLSGA